MAHHVDIVYKINVKQCNEVFSLTSDTSLTTDDG